MHPGDARDACESPRSTSRILHVASRFLLVVAVAVAGFGAMQTARLYLEPAPLHVPHRVSTPEEDAAVTPRLVASLVGLPAAGFLFIAAWLVSRPRRRRVTALFAASCVAAAAAIHAGWIFLHLPYGFGSGYDHANASERAHLRISGGVAGAALATALGLGAAGVVAFRMGAPHSGQRDP